MRPVVVSLVTVAAAAVITGALLVGMHHPNDEIAALVAVLAAIATAWLVLTHLATRLNVAGSLRRQYAAGVLGAVGLVLVSALVGTELMVVSRRDAELVAIMLLFSVIVALRVASLLSGHAAASRRSRTPSRVICAAAPTRCRRRGRASWPSSRSRRTRWRAT